MIVPSKEEVMAMCAVVLGGMNEEEIDRLTENIKIANLTMERVYLNDNIFDKLNKDFIMLIKEITETEFAEREYDPEMEYNRIDEAIFG